MTWRFLLIASLTITLLLASACGTTQTVPPGPTPLSTATPKSEATIQIIPTPRLDAVKSVGREILTYDELITGFVPASPVAEGALTIPTNDAPAGHTFEGRLELVGEMETGDISILRGDPEVGPELAHLPEFDFEFIQHENYLVPSRRGLIITEHPYWNYLIGPGRVWMEEGDGGYSRASFPFALVWKGSNAIFNGVMTFLYNDQHISKVWYQITQETSISTSL